jgi:hypothetical protein
MVAGAQLVERADHGAPVHQRGDPIADCPQRIQIVGDHDHGKAQAALQAEDQAVELTRPDRIETGGWLVEEQDLRVEGQGAGESGPLAHTARQLGRVLVAGVDRQADQGELQTRNLI